jgi:hypothetical protein
METKLNQRFEQETDFPMVININSE